jgi:hypothetical protein
LTARSDGWRISPCDGSPSILSSFLSRDRSFSYSRILRFLASLLSCFRFVTCYLLYMLWYQPREISDAQETLILSCCIYLQNNLRYTLFFYFMVSWWMYQAYGTSAEPRELYRLVHKCQYFCKMFIIVKLQNIFASWNNFLS